jgi:two-component system chemotaxis response regulator CheY
MGLRVLIVDDSPLMRVFVRRVLKLSGVEVDACSEASNGLEALEVLRC